MNVNFPDCAPGDVQGIQITRQGRRDPAHLARATRTSLDPRRGDGLDGVQHHQLGARRLDVFQHLVEVARAHAGRAAHRHVEVPGRFGVVAPPVIERTVLRLAALTALLGEKGGNIDLADPDEYSQRS